MMKELKKKIFDESHLNSVKNLARQYFANSSVDFFKLEKEDFEELRDLIQIEIAELASKPDYHIIKDLRVKPKIINNKEFIQLRIEGSYFGNREGISFQKDPFDIGFCAEMDGCNQTPFIKGFIKWVDICNTNDS